MTTSPAEQRTHRAKEILAVVGRAYPRAWREVDALRHPPGADGPTWPDWCFLPLNCVPRIISGDNSPNVPIERTPHIGLVGALAAWRVSQRIFRFHPEIYDALIKTKVPPDLPRDPLYRLPSWCVYIETPGMYWPVVTEYRPLHGVWVHLDRNYRDRQHPKDELRFLLDCAVEPKDALDLMRGCVAMPLLLGEGTIADSMDRVLQWGVAQMKAMGLPVRAASDLSQQVASIVWPILSLVLYLCAENAEIGDGTARLTNPAPTRTKSGDRFFPPNSPTVCDVGVRLGSALRRAYEARATGAESVPTGRKMPPHVRDFHWHTFICGPRSSPEQQWRSVKWMPPIPVNLKDYDELPAVVRPVQSSGQ